MKALLNFIILSLYLWPGIILGQQVVTGKVVSASDSQPLPGAYVSAKQGRATTVTKTDGSFSLTIQSPYDSLTVKYVGFETVVLAPPFAAPLIIRLTENQKALDEVRITTGYYELSKERTTGSFSVVTNEVLNQNTSPDILSRLNGVTNGLMIDDRLSRTRRINVRGLSTIYGETEPLIVLNNFPFDGDINSINPNDVENITILKDAAAASIWGVRAANGVIVIRTKRAGLNSPMKVSFNSNVLIGREPDMYYRNAISSADFIEVEKMLFQKGYYQGNEQDPSNPPLTPVVEVLIASRDGLIPAAEANAKIEQLKSLDVRRDFQKYLYQNSIDQQFNASLQGGGEKSSWNYSAGYDRSTGFTGGKSDRITLRAENMFQFSNRFRIRPSVSFTRHTGKTGKPDFMNIRTAPSLELYPYAQLADQQGNPLPVVRNYRSSYATNISSLGLESLQYVPLDDFSEEQNLDGGQEILLSIDGNYRFGKGLSAQLAYQYDRNSIERSQQFKETSFYARELVNQYAQPVGDGTFVFPVPKGGILDNYSENLNSHTARGQLNYDREFGKHSLVALAGAEIRDVSRKSKGDRTYGFDESGLISIPVDYTTVYNFFTSDNSGGIPYRTNFSHLLNRYTALFMNGAYTYDNRYTISSSVRRDASNLFGVNSNQKGVPLWSAGAAWNLHNEKFFESELLEYLQLRVTYGYNGNLSKDLSALATVQQYAQNLNNMPYGMVRSFPNPDLSWEKVAISNAGLDFRTRNNRISGSIDFYRKHSKNLIADQSIDPTSGVVSGFVRRNVANTKARGVDLQLFTDNINGTIKWKSAFIFNWYQDKVTSIEEATSSATSYLSSGLGVRPFLGKPLRSIITYKWVGLDPATGNPIGVFEGDESQAYSSIVYSTKLEEMDHHGSAVPTFFGGFSNTFSFRNVSLYVNIAYRLGYSFLRPSISYTQLFKSWTGNGDFSRRWQKPGDELSTDVPSMTYPASSSRDQFYTSSSALVEKGDNIRLQDVNLTYRFGRLGNLPIKDFQIYTFLRNPGFVWRANEKGLDPDYTGFLPITPSISFGLKANF